MKSLSLKPSGAKQQLQIPNTTLRAFTIHLTPLTNLLIYGIGQIIDWTIFWTIVLDHFFWTIFFWDHFKEGSTPLVLREG